MPTAFSHAFVGAAIAILPTQRSSRWLALACACVAAAPDLDVAGFWLGVPYAHPLGHRGLSHSIPFALVVGLTGGLYLLHRARDRAARIRAISSGLALALACASHGVLDAMTDAGLGIGFWLPFSDERRFLPWRPIMTSSLDPRAAFGAHGLRVLLNEAVWIGLPTALVVLVARASHRMRPKGV